MRSAFYPHMQPWTIANTIKWKNQFYMLLYVDLIISKKYIHILSMWRMLLIQLTHVNTKSREVYLVTHHTWYMLIQLTHVNTNSKEVCLVSHHTWYMLLIQLTHVNTNSREVCLVSHHTWNMLIQLTHVNTKSRSMPCFSFTLKAGLR